MLTSSAFCLLHARPLPYPFLLPLLLLLVVPQAPAQERKILSPRDSVVLSLDTSTIAISYSRPSMRGRVIMGDLVPWNKVWRTGANQASHLRTSFDMLLGGMPVPRGVYTLWSIPSPSGWTVIVNKQTGQWGTQYDERQDLARFPAKVRRLTALRDTFTVALKRTSRNNGTVTLMWERTSVEVPFRRTEALGVLSPLDSASTRLNGKRIIIRYSRPSMRGRSIWGVVVPWDTVWRTGANLATVFETGVDLSIGTVRIPKGSYTLYSLPSPDSFSLIFSTIPGGSPPQYDPGHDLARVSMKMDRLRRSVDPFRIWFQSKGPSRVTLNLGWADRIYSVDLAIP
jgi:hypothetical protein